MASSGNDPRLTLDSSRLRTSVRSWDDRDAHLISAQDGNLERDAHLACYHLDSVLQYHFSSVHLSDTMPSKRRVWQSDDWRADGIVSVGICQRRFRCLIVFAGRCWRVRWDVYLPAPWTGWYSGGENRVRNLRYQWGIYEGDSPFRRCE